MSGTSPRVTAPVEANASLPERAAPLLFVLLWSSSFLGTRVGLRHMSPLWFVALRMVLASAILLSVMALRRGSVMAAPRRAWSLSRMEWLHCAVVGIATQSILLMTAHVAMTHTEA